MPRFVLPRSFVLLTFLLVLAPGCTDDGAGAVDVITEYGEVRGTEGDGFLEWLGIPYAAAPTGDLRWRAPQAHPGWEGVREARTTGSPCPQVLPVNGGLVAGVEDCLFINVHTPDPMPENAPVMVWFHGGGFTLGDGLQTDGGTRADLLVQGPEEIVVVSMNYRLGALGFLAHPDLSDESSMGVSGNYGFLDQVAALEWVQNNIANFGGDPDRVTIAGESAGGMSVCAHMTSPESTDLFDRAIIQSGPCQDSLDLMAGEAQGLRFEAEPSIACDGAADVLECMRGVPAADILAALPGAENFVDTGPENGLWFPVYDGNVFPFPMSMAIANGPTNPVPLLVGFNADEGSVFLTLGGDTSAPTEGEYTALIEGLVDPMYAPSVLAHYPYDATPGVNNLESYADAIGDQLLTCPSRVASMGFADAMDSWVYYFTYLDAEFQLPPPPGFDLGAFHSAELQYVFGHPSSLTRSEFTGDDLTLHHVIRDYWVRFIATGDPNGGGAPTWPEYDPVSDTHLVLDTAISTGSAAQKTDCDLWSTIPTSAWSP